MKYPIYQPEKTINRLIFVIGFSIGFFLMDDIIWYLYYFHAFQHICFCGFHFHHSYLGGILFIFAIAISYYNKGIKNVLATRIMYFCFGAGLGLMLGDLVSHLVYDPFYLECEQEPYNPFD